jgi:hypothetical protein
VSPNYHKRLKNRLCLTESPLFEAKIYRKLSIIRQKFIDNSSDYWDFDNDKLSITNTRNYFFSIFDQIQKSKCFSELEKFKYPNKKVFDNYFRISLFYKIHSKAYAQFICSNCDVYIAIALCSKLQHNAIAI